MLPEMDISIVDVSWEKYSMLCDICNKFIYTSNSWAVGKFFMLTIRDVERHPSWNSSNQSSHSGSTMLYLYAMETFVTVHVKHQAH